MESGNQRVAAQAVGLLNPEWVATVNDFCGAIGQAAPADAAE